MQVQKEKFEKAVTNMAAIKNLVFMQWLRQPMKEYVKELSEAMPMGIVLIACV